ncbi:MAG: hypothetical protein H6742_10620 [Alphaproteobacteria bacterium]|nr:hypothetical protein [Alphaproteobacteria bacterium]
MLVPITLLLLLWGRPADAAGEPPLDRAVAVVGDRVVTASEVELSWALAQADPGPVAPLRPRGTDPLEWWLELVILRELAQDISVYQPDQAAVRERVGRLRDAFEDPAELRALQERLGVSDDELAGWVYSRLVVERFVHRNIGLASEAGGDDEDTYLVRYAAWLASAREGVALRRIPLHRDASVGDDATTP